MNTTGYFALGKIISPSVRLLSLCFFSLCGLIGCASQHTDTLTIPSVELPSAWNMPGGNAKESWPDVYWWQNFGSDELTNLVLEGQRNNFEVAAAVTRVRQAELQAKIAGAPLFPYVEATSGINRQFPEIPGTAPTSIGGSLEISYEVDFWGKNKANLSAAEAALLASIYDKITVNLTVTSGIVSTYLEILSLRDNLRSAKENVANAENVLALLQSQSRNGAASALDLSRQRSIVAGQKELIPNLVQQERDAEATLAILLGQTSQKLSIKGNGLDGILMPQIAPGLPSELLSRRPDIRRVEAQLSEANANIAVARASLFPSIYLTGSTGAQSGALLSLFTGSNFLTNIGTSLVAPIFDAGTLKSQRDLAIERKQELIQIYHSVVANAFYEVEKSLGLIESLNERYQLKNVELEQAKYAFDLSQIRYRAGAEDLMTVIDTQRSLSDARSQLGEIKLERLRATVSLYKALGGGWQDTRKIP